MRLSPFVRFSGILLLLFLIFDAAPLALAQALPPVQPNQPVMPSSPGGPASPFNIADLTSPGRISTTLQIVALITLLSLAPAILMMTTSFVRIVVVLGFVRRALGTQEVPPNQVILGLALFLTFFVMAPTFQRINNESLQPYIAGQLTQPEAWDAALDPIREFLFEHTRRTDLALFVNISGMDKPASREDIPLSVLLPSFLISELKTAFIIGFVIYIPFLIIDMVVASILLSMGMMMLPPPMISLPFKVLLFVLVDGWALIIGSLVQSI